MRIQIALALIVATAVPAVAGDAGSKDANASDMIAALRASGVKPVKVKGKKTSVIAVQDLDCEITSNENLDASDLWAGVTEQSCTAKVGKKKITLRESAWVLEALARFGLQQDCAMSHCRVIAEAVSCTIDPAVETFTSGGRFSCAIKNGE